MDTLIFLIFCTPSERTGKPLKLDALGHPCRLLVLRLVPLKRSRGQCRCLFAQAVSVDPSSGRAEAIAEFDGTVDLDWLLSGSLAALCRPKFPGPGLCPHIVK